jgi:hypothetical protein
VVYRRDILAAHPNTPVSDLLRAVDFIGERESVDRLLEPILAHSRNLTVVRMASDPAVDQA